jgi:hypothetical protein
VLIGSFNTILHRWCVGGQGFTYDWFLAFHGLTGQYTLSPSIMMSQPHWKAARALSTSPPLNGWLIRFTTFSSLPECYQSLFQFFFGFVDRRKYADSGVLYRQYLELNLFVISFHYFPKTSILPK